MKALKTIFIILFVMMITIPMLLFNFQEDYVSQADNRVLQNNPFLHPDELGDPFELSSEMTSYCNDRVGLRQEAMSLYNTLNDKAFGVMEHPYYMKGQDGYIFMRKEANVVFSDFHRNFARMIVLIDQYCKERGTPFLFVFEPEKLSVMREYAPAGMVYDNSWVDEFLSILEENGVDYVDNTEILMEKYAQGEPVFNKQYDAGHWNDIGAFYGVNYILKHLQSSIPEIHINTEAEFDIGTEDVVDLQQNGLKVEETVPLYTPKREIEYQNDSYEEELKLNKDHHYFNHFVNDQVSSPRILCFQGSYMNTRGYKFMANALRDYTAVHDYENIFDFEYYYNIFEPEYVIFEVAEYTFLDMFFDPDRLAEFETDPAPASFDTFAREERSIEDIHVAADVGESVTDISVTGLPRETDYAYAVMNGREYGIRLSEDGASFSVSSDRFLKDELTVIAVDTAEEKKTVFRP